MKPLFDMKSLASFDCGIGSLVEDYAFLYGWVALLRPARIAEVGTNHGVSTLVMAQALEDCEAPGHIFTVDINLAVLTIARRQIKEASLEHRITVIPGDVSKLPPEDFDLAFIDGDHSYEGAKRDLTALYERSRVLLLHDARQYPAVRKAAEEFSGERLFLSPPVGRCISKGQVVARTSPGWFVLIPPHA